VKILYKQLQTPEHPQDTLLWTLGIRQLFLKQLSVFHDSGQITKKHHHHRGFEVHIITNGQQDYQAGASRCSLKPGQFLLIPPCTAHCARSSAPHTQKISLTFSLEPGSPLATSLPDQSTCFWTDCPSVVSSTLQNILSELACGHSFSQWVVSSQAALLVIYLLRASGLHTQPPEICLPDESPRLTLARQYVSDNIEFAPTVSDLAAYCHLSTRQLTRLFLQELQCSPSTYIRDVRLRKIETLLQNTDLSLKTISEQMHFNSEYYFNTFFKRHAGMTPAAYKRMHQKNSTV